MHLNIGILTRLNISLFWRILYKMNNPFDKDFVRFVARFVAIVIVALIVTYFVGQIDTKSGIKAEVNSSLKK